MERKKKERTPDTVTTPSRGKSRKDSSKDFDFGGLTREERRSLIKEVLLPGHRVDLPFTVEGSEYVPTEWVVVLTTQGNVYQEPVPRYMDTQYFVNVLAAIPSSPQNGNRISFDAEVYSTPFKVKGVECTIHTVSANGSRKENLYIDAFHIENGTAKVSGSLVFSKNGKGFTLKESRAVISEIVRTMNEYEEVIV